MLVGTASAAEFDNVKQFTRDDGRIKVGDPTDYGTIKIKNAFGLGRDLQDFTLNYNTYSCSEGGTYCLATGTTKLYEEGQLISGIKFLVDRGKGLIETPFKNYKLEVELTLPETQPIYGDVCAIDPKNLTVR